MSLRKGTLEQYYNSPEGIPSAGCKKGDTNCYQNTVKPRTEARLEIYLDAL